MLKQSKFKAIWNSTICKYAGIFYRSGWRQGKDEFARYNQHLPPSTGKVRTYKKWSHVIGTEFLIFGDFFVVEKFCFKMVVTLILIVLDLFHKNRNRRVTHLQAILFCEHPTWMSYRQRYFQSSRPIPPFQTDEPKFLIFDKYHRQNGACKT